MKKDNVNILVIGGGGKNGRRVVQKLKALGYKVFSTTRVQEEAGEDARFFDWNDAETYDEALQDIQKVYIVHPDTSTPGADEQIRELVNSLVKNSVSKAVLLSGRGQESVRKCEDILIGSPLKWAIVRSAWFNQNFSEGHFLHGIQSGEVVFMAGSVKEPFVDLDDLSDVVVECLIHEKHNGGIYEITGSELFTFEEAVRMIGHKLNRNIQYRYLGKNDYQNLLKKVGLPAFVADHMAVAFDEILDGRNENTGDGIQKVLGRNPKKFNEFVHSNQFN
ncbi:NmrA family transcriptional regulator [Chryseobacterium angstadtii]|uniref:NmrA family transcriptional regulator n=1 Tax=Chryseobacterium angstadtii TaxID=558151 RepID=A0A0J7IFS5_9FLAO|nr:NAD(P)H-binding protein [Chryseobacterium angstadtii]KMQ64962.1 NmrA family transcriptional regulator [Chryseobacterium angstadtii]